MLPAGWRDFPAIMRQIGKQTLILALALCAALAAAPAVAAEADVQAASLTPDALYVVNPLTGVALDGLDPVSYFTESEPVPGSPDHEHVWAGVPWYFASAANRAVFMQAPEIYAPQFGGHGLTGLSRGFLTDGNPHIYTVFSNRLYLFYSTGNRQAFEAARLAAIERAETTWRAFLGPNADAPPSMEP